MLPSIFCDNNPQSVIALDPDNDEHYELTPNADLGATLMLPEPTQVQSTVSPNTFVAQGAGSYSNADLKNF